MEKSATLHRRLEGTVVSSAMEKTCVVLVERWKWHDKYKKSYRTRRRYHVHDPKGVAKVGMVVQFEECRPLSKTKRWRLIEKLERQGTRTP